jgi:hypothetical protein
MKAKHQIGLTIKFFLVLVTASLAVSGQNLEVPKNEFSISLSKDKLELSHGENDQLDIGILKSKGYQNSKIKMGMSSSVPKGVSIAFDPNKGTFDFTKAIISIGDDATPGTYLLIVNATLQYKTKGSILKLVIKE